MRNINIKTTLAINPRRSQYEYYTMTRGAVAGFHYNLKDVWVTFDMLEQLTFAFRQKRKIWHYNMFKYLVLTDDEEVDETKTYYTDLRLTAAKSRRCTASVVTEPEPNPSEAGYYEEVDITDGQNNLYYIIDEHFYQDINTDPDYINFVLSSQETMKFAPTDPRAKVEFEITLRLNTDDQESITNRDAVIICQQPPVMVNDSLYGQIDKNNVFVVSTDPDNLASTKVPVKE